MLLDIPKISVILPVYNVEKYISACLDSLTKQTLKEIEIICINDGSTDNSLEILKQYSKKDPRIISITQKNAGAGAARNKGLSLANGKYLSFLDADDFFEPTMLEDAYKACEEQQLDFVVFRSDSYENETKRFIAAKWTIKDNLLPNKTVFDFHDIDHDIFKVFNGWAWDKLYLRDFVLNNKLFFQEQRTTNDLLFVFSALICASRISTIGTILAHHRKSVSSSLSVTREKSWDCFYYALLALRDKLTELYLYKDLEQDFVNYALHFSLWNINTLTPGKSLEKLFLSLKKEYWAELKLNQFSQDYFYHQGEYLQYQRIMENNYRTFLKEKTSIRLQEGSFNNSNLYFKNYFCKLIFSIRENGLRHTYRKIKQKIFKNKK